MLKKYKKVVIFLKKVIFLDKTYDTQRQQKHAAYDDCSLFLPDTEIEKYCRNNYFKNTDYLQSCFKHFKTPSNY